MAQATEKTKRKSQFYEDLMREKGKIIYYLVKEHKYTWKTIADMKNEDIRKIYNDMPNTIQKSITNYYNLCYDAIKESTYVFYSLHGHEQSTPQAIRTYMKRYCEKFHKPFPEEVRVNDNVHFTTNNFMDMNEQFFKVSVNQLDKPERKLVKLPKVRETYKGFLKKDASTKSIPVPTAQKELVIELSRRTGYKVLEILDMTVYDVMKFYDDFSDEMRTYVRIVLDEFDANKMECKDDTPFFVTFGTRYGTPHKIMKSSLSMFFSYAYEKYGYARKDNKIVVA
jgi:hypothetical protein